MFATLITSKMIIQHFSAWISSLWYNLIKSHDGSGYYYKEAKRLQVLQSHALPSWKLANYLDRQV